MEKILPDVASDFTVEIKIQIIDGTTRINGRLDVPPLEDHT